MDKSHSDPQSRSLRTELEEQLAKQALALNYEYGMTSRIMPTESKDGAHTAQLLLELTHSSLDFDMTFTVRFTDDRARGVSWELSAPENAGGTVWQEAHRSADEFSKALAGLPYFVQGFFAGRASNSAAAAPSGGA